MDLRSIFIDCVRHELLQEDIHGFLAIALRFGQRSATPDAIAKITTAVCCTLPRMSELPRHYKDSRHTPTQCCAFNLLRIQRMGTCPSIPQKGPRRGRLSTVGNKRKVVHLCLAWDVHFYCLHHPMQCIRTTSQSFGISVGKRPVRTTLSRPVFPLLLFDLLPRTLGQDILDVFDVFFSPVARGRQRS